MMLRVRLLVDKNRARLLFPVTSRLDAIEARLDGIGGRLDRIEQVMADVQLAIETVGSRVASASEGSAEATESRLRLGRRIDEIERLLGAPAGDH